MDGGNKKSIIDIFNDMSFRKNHDLRSQERSTISEDVQNPIIVSNIVEEAIKAHCVWKLTDSTVRADILDKIFTSLPKTTGSGTYSFSFYSDLITVEKFEKYEPKEIVLLILPLKFPLFIFNNVVSAAFAAGSAVIILPQDFESFTSYADKFLEAGIPKGLFAVVPHTVKNEELLLSSHISHIMYYGNPLCAQYIFMESLCESFNFLCPNNTSAIVLESCDLNAAVNKILYETMDSSCNNMWGVSKILVQESIFQKFVELLKFHIEKFLINEMKKQDNSESMIRDAIKAGSEIFKKNGATIIFNYQGEETYFTNAIIRVLSFRTSKEGVSLINNSTYSLGTSVWTEISSEALEIASALHSSNIWINCHGTPHGMPIYSFGNSGNCVLGGRDGIFSYISLMPKISITFNEKASLEKKNLYIPDCNFQAVDSLINLAHHSLKNWDKESKKFCLQKISEKFAKINLQNLAQIISQCSHWSNINYFNENDTQDLFTIQKKVPLGVIAVFFGSTSLNLKFFENVVSIITPALAFGNSVILAVTQINDEMLSVIKLFNECLPKNLLQITVEAHAEYYLASHPNVQSFWVIEEESQISQEFYLKIKNQISLMLKNCWFLPKNIVPSYDIFSGKCLKNKIIWMTKVDQI